MLRVITVIIMASIHERLCSVDGCSKTVRSARAQYCEMHYGRIRRRGTIELPPPAQRQPCTVEGCHRMSRSSEQPLCETHYYRVRRNGTLATTADMTVLDSCKHCGVEMPDFKARAYRSGKYCSSRCQARDRQGHPVTRVCLYCENEYVPIETKAPGKRRDLHTCSDVCQRKHIRKQQREYYAMKMATDPAYREKVKRNELRRKALKLAALVEEFDPTEIFERDGWTCGLCSKPIDPTLKWPDSGFASIDHIIPLSRGGLHERANVQAAHLGCNCAKNNRLPGETARPASTKASSLLERGRGTSKVPADPFATAPYPDSFIRRTILGT